MFTRLNNVDARKINDWLTHARLEGGAAGGQVLTLVVVSNPENAPTASANALAAGKLHPSRVLLVIRDHSSEVPEGSTGVDVEIRIGDGLPGEMITLWLAGEAAYHSRSLIVPLLLPQLPVVIWWPNKFPDSFDDSQVAQVSTRRIVDTSASPNGEASSIAALEKLIDIFEPSTTDLSWTRLTKWRALLVAMVDQAKSKPNGAKIVAPADSAPAALLAGWLSLMLDIEVERIDSPGEGMGSVTLHTDAGDMVLERKIGTQGIIKLPGQPDRPVALSRRDVEDLMGEELVELNGDPMFDKIMKYLSERKS
ncbi:glucose-6-phosphate dehydrogenase assembly protein OpcA [Propionimicrobium lymphophilum]|uniref:Glucose-6-phosphate dehydrogenase assembly protein OpcA n=1 Tax=Propionimicrobium lymphophilum ACS-093-V-SCH5 TaxID=883161 RepID=S2X090_9ACTN|nr:MULTISPECIES: glucose-6-phosphate dehydrogenase assembly protein OpcA [Propionimicrobium]EPD33389.1 glucose-6-phosphate dehydrogenase assembly protein OpcA [Propionimicrobium lymphophilum ACS-093-V-SCH5]ETJ97913.1 putative glucose-6-phosphate dehydrogenase assembly protein OpcA [Propionimicrobium sp. BV2F7]MDK7709770.1 glucose-6-phosphate dehydrogenase assembly protein OpcA [Propionimicrobium lymphophilum]MDK7733968.1 glucose-6-phosphate dehydrogenase assembly protein OpcA [Propionimicrobium